MFLPLYYDALAGYLFSEPVLLFSHDRIMNLSSLVFYSSLPTGIQARKAHFLLPRKMYLLHSLQQGLPDEIGVDGENAVWDRTAGITQRSNSWKVVQFNQKEGVNH